MIDAEELPEGWALTTLGEIVENSKAKAEPGERDDSPYLGLEHIESGTSRIVGQGIGKDAKSVKNAFLPGDILYGKLRPYLNKVCSPDFAGICSTDILVLRPKQSINSRFLHMLLTTQPFLDHAVANSNGINLPRTSYSALAWFKIALPPLAEQKRIVSRLDSLQARSRAAREALAEVPAMLEQYRQSVLAAAFRGNLTVDWRERNPNTEPASVLLDRIRAERRKLWEAKYPKKKYSEPEPVDDSDLPELPEGWCWARWSEVGFCQNGTAFPSNSYSAEGTKLLRPGNLHVSGEITWNAENTRYLPEVFEEDNPNFIVGSGEIVMNLTAQSLKDEFLGRVCLSSNGEKCLLNQRIARITPVLLDNRFCLQVFKSSVFRKYVEGLNTGSLIQHMFTSQVYEFVFPLPPFCEQATIIDAVNQHCRSKERVASASNIATQYSVALEQSLLAQAFRGELVPQDPSEESASAMLTRMRNGGIEPKAFPQFTLGKLSRLTLMLLHQWNNAASREMVDRGVHLMLDDDLRERLLANGAQAKPRKRGRQPATPDIALPDLLGKMVDAGYIEARMRGSVQTLHANAAKAKAAYDTAVAEDLKRLQEALKLMDDIDEKQLAAEVAEAYRGRTIEDLVRV